MAKAPLQARIDHIREAIADIARITAGKTYADYAGSRDIAAAVAIERLSEASRHIPAQLKERHPQIDWVGVASVGNVLRHIDDQIITEEIWKIVTDDLEPLRLAIEGIGVWRSPGIV